MRYRRTRRSTTTELHLRRILTAVALSGAALAATTATALPAQAQATQIKVRTVAISGGNAMAVSGTTVRDVITFSGSGGTITVTTNNPAVVTGGACTPLSSTRVRCTGVSRLQAQGGSGNDQVTNDTAVPMGTNGGSGDDVLTGGSSFDTLNGSIGVDTGNGRGGFDTCGGIEIRTSCEEVTS